MTNEIRSVEGTPVEPVRHSFLARMKGAAMLDVDTYEELEADKSATGDAAGVVALVAVASAIGASGGGTLSILAAVSSAVVGWLVWSGLTYIIGDKMLGGTATWGEMLRTIGFAQTPGLLLCLGVYPKLNMTVFVVVTIWTFVAGVIAIRQALDFGTDKALLTAAFGVIILAIPRLIF